MIDRVNRVIIVSKRIENLKNVELENTLKKFGLK